MKASKRDWELPIIKVELVATHPDGFQIHKNNENFQVYSVIERKYIGVICSSIEEAIEYLQ